MPPSSRRRFLFLKESRLLLSNPPHFKVQICIQRYFSSRHVSPLLSSTQTHLSPHTVPSHDLHIYLNPESTQERKHLVFVFLSPACFTVRDVQVQTLPANTTIPLFTAEEYRVHTCRISRVHVCQCFNPFTRCCASRWLPILATVNAACGVLACLRHADFASSQPTCSNGSAESYDSSFSVS